MNQHYDNILHQRDKRFNKIVQSVLKNDPDREDMLQEFYIRFITYSNLFNRLKGNQIYYYSTFILKQIRNNYNKSNDLDLYDEYPDVESKDDIIDDLDRKIVMNNFSMLSHYEKELINLYYIEGLNYREINEITKIPITSLNLTIRRSIKKIKKFYDI